MPRSVRQRSEADIYHIILRGEGGKILFEDNEDRLVFLKMLTSAIEDANAEVLAWCLMSNHVHLLAHVEYQAMPRVMQKLQSGYAVYFNGKHNHVGHVFSGRYKSIPIDSDEYLIIAVCYIHLNPVEEGLSETCEYRWSSYNDYLHSSGMTSTGFVLEVVGGLGPFVDAHIAKRKRESSPKVVLESAGRRHGDQAAMQLASRVLGGLSPSDVGALDKARRDEAIAALRRSGLTAKQVQRLTGIGRGIVERVKWRE